MDWETVRAFRMVAEVGSLSEAARRLGKSQPTLSRRIAAIEADIGAPLFERRHEGLVLTATGAALLAPAEAMAAAAGRLELIAAGREERLAGVIRITASQIVATYLMPEILTDLRIAEPRIQIELVASDQTENLLRREADIAVRMYRPTQNDVITRKLGEMQIGLFAAQSYLERRGTPRRIEDLRDHDFIGYDRSTLLIDGMRDAGLQMKREDFAFRSDDQSLCWRMVVAGFGLGFMQEGIGAREPKVVALPSLGPLPTLPVWLTAHEELRANPRVRRVFDFLAERLAAVARQGSRDGS